MESDSDFSNASVASEGVPRADWPAPTTTASRLHRVLASDSTKFTAPSTIPSPRAGQDEQLSTVLNAVWQLQEDLRELSLHQEGEVCRHFREWAEQQDRLANIWNRHLMELDRHLRRLEDTGCRPSMTVPRSALRGCLGPQGPMPPIASKPDEPANDPPELCGDVQAERKAGDLAVVCKPKNGAPQDCGFFANGSRLMANLAPMQPDCSKMSGFHPKEHPKYTSSPWSITGKSNSEAATVDSHLHLRRKIRKDYYKRFHREELSKRMKAEQEDSKLTLAQRMVRTYAYEVFSLGLVIVNAGIIGWQVQYRALRGEVPAHEYTLEAVFCVLFILDILMRAIPERRSLLNGRDLGWTIFDCVVVLMMFIEQVMYRLSQMSSPLFRMSVLRVFRLIRIVRVWRIMRVLKFVRELRIIASSLLNSFKSLVWAMAVLSVLFYVIGIMFVQGVAEHCSEHVCSSDEKEAIENFGTLSRSILTLFQAMTGGVSWGEPYESIAMLGVSYKATFLVFISFSILAVANIVTAVFVEGVMQSAQHDREVLVQEQMRNDLVYLERVRFIFDELDKDADGSITFEELMQAVKDHRVVDYFNAYTLDITDVQVLFVLLDHDQKGVIDIDEFLLGCIRLKGEAKCLDMARLQYDCEWIVHSLEVLIASVTKLTGESSAPKRVMSSAWRLNACSGEPAEIGEDVCYHDHRAVGL